MSDETIPYPHYDKPEQFSPGEEVLWNWDGVSGHWASAKVIAIHPKTLDCDVVVETSVTFTDGTRETKTYRRRIKFHSVLRMTDIPEHWRAGWLDQVHNKNEAAQHYQLRGFLEHQWGF